MAQTQILPAALSLPQLDLIKEVRERIGEIPAVSLETVLMRGKEASRFQGIDGADAAFIVDLARLRGVELPTHTN